MPSLRVRSRSKSSAPSSEARKGCRCRSRARPASRLTPPRRSLRALEPVRTNRGDPRRLSINSWTTSSSSGTFWTSSMTTVSASGLASTRSRRRSGRAAYLRCSSDFSSRSIQLPESVRAARWTCRCRGGRRGRSSRQGPGRTGRWWSVSRLCPFHRPVYFTTLPSLLLRFRRNTREIVGQAPERHKPRAPCRGPSAAEGHATRWRLTACGGGRRSGSGRRTEGSTSGRYGSARCRRRPGRSLFAAHSLRLGQSPSRARGDGQGGEGREGVFESMGCGAKTSGHAGLVSLIALMAPLIAAVKAPPTSGHPGVSEGGPLCLWNDACARCSFST